MPQAPKYHSRLMRLRVRLHELYYQSSVRAVRFRYSVIAVDLAIIAFFIAALNSVEPHIQNLATIDIFFAEEEWAKARRPGAEAMAKLKLDALAKRLQGRDYLEDHFTAGDLMMVAVLRNLRHTDLAVGHPVLGPYMARCEARPAFQRALKAQMASFQPEPEMA